MDQKFINHEESLSRLHNKWINEGDKFDWADLSELFQISIFMRNYGVQADDERQKWHKNYERLVDSKGNEKEIQ